MNNVDLAILIPILVSLGFFTMILGIYYLKNKERMAMIERGIEPPVDLPKKPNNNSFTLTLGLLLIGAGLGLFIAYLMDYFVFKMDSNPAIYFSLIAFFGGLGLMISYFIERKANQKKEL